MSPAVAAYFDHTTVDFYENGKKITIDDDNRLWNLTITKYAGKYLDMTLNIIIPKDRVSTDGFDEGPVVLTYKNDDKTVLIKRRVKSYEFKFQNADDYAKFKRFRLEKVYNNTV